MYIFDIFQTFFFVFHYYRYSWFCCQYFYNRVPLICWTPITRDVLINITIYRLWQLIFVHSIQESLANETNDGSNRIPCSCPCKELMENVKRMLDETCRSVGQKTETAANGVDNDEIRWSSAPRPAETTLGSVRVDDSPFVAVTTVNNDDDDNES